MACVATLGIAQQFKYRATVGPAETDGFYRIALNPQLVGVTQPSFNDLRIFDSQDHEVPYWVDTEARRHVTTQFAEYPVLSRQRGDSATVIVLHNAQKQRIDNLSLFIANADVQKQLRLMGSHDRQAWYSVKESEWVRPVGDGKTVAELKVVNFPLVDYEYLRIEIDDRRTSPIHVQKAGYYLSESSLGSYVPLKSTVSQVDSVNAKTTWVSLGLPSLATVDKVTFEVSWPKLYLRQANIYAAEDGEPLRYVASVELKSGGPIDIELPSVRCDKIVMEVVNRDNPPLAVASGQAFMLKRHCVAQLAKGETYLMRFGDAHLPMPQYDIAYFRGQVPTNLPVLNHAEIEAEAVRPPAPAPWYANPWVIWGAIGAVVALLGYLTWSMMKGDAEKEL